VQPARSVLSDHGRIRGSCAFGQVRAAWQRKVSVPPRSRRQYPEISPNALSRPTGPGITLNQCPIPVALAIFLAIADAGTCPDAMICQIICNRVGLHYTQVGGAAKQTTSRSRYKQQPTQHRKLERGCECTQEILIPGKVAEDELAGGFYRVDASGLSPWPIRLTLVANMC
jgi:hypothetical protein